MSKLVPLLSRYTGLTELDIERIVNRAPDTYKSYKIDKRNGSGQRTISQPAREVKALQRALMGRLSVLPIHDTAMAYRQGLSIRKNAQAHAQNGPILKYDFESFFPSIRAVDWESYCLKNKIFSDHADLDRSVNLFFHRPKGSTVLQLAIGAPSSPWLSNVLMYEFDDSISRAVASDRVTYTRYADDLTFSAPRTGFLTVVDAAVRKAVREIKCPRLKLNEAKTALVTKKFRRVVTGLVITNSGEISIGRDKKRLLRAMIDRAMKETIGYDNSNKLIGYIAHVRSVEPSLYFRLKAHYGENFLSIIREKNKELGTVEYPSA